MSKRGLPSITDTCYLTVPITVGSSRKQKSNPWRAERVHGKRGEVESGRMVEEEWNGTTASKTYAYINIIFLRVFLPSSLKVLWDGFLTPEGLERVPNDLRILHDMIALLQENKIRKREVSISTYTS